MRLIIALPARAILGTIALLLTTCLTNAPMLRSAQHANPAAISSDARYYDIGAPITTDLWVDPISGSDNNSGATRAHALRSLNAAWERIPQNTMLAETGYRVMLAAGEYPESVLPNYLESRHGTAQFPVIIQAADGRGSAVLRGDLNIFDAHYLYLIDLVIAPTPPGDTLHCEQCDHLLMRGLRLDGGQFEPDGTEEVAHDNLKVNQSKHVYLEDSEITGATDNAVDYVAVQYGHVVGNGVYNAQDWCMYVKGGSAHLRVEANEFSDCGTGGFTAGQGTGFQFMTSPWLHYEAHDVKVINNIVHDTAGAGLGVNGGHNILLAYNTLYRIGGRDHVLEFTFGARSCDGEADEAGRERCGSYRAAGGWGTTVVDDGTNYVRIPNRNVYVYNNIVYNPADYQHGGQHFAIPGPQVPPPGSNAPNPTLADENLQLRGNIIWNGPLDLALGIEDDEQGCQPTNRTCNAAQLRADNAINTVEPQLSGLACGSLRPLVDGNLFGISAYPIPDFPANDLPAIPRSPEGTLTNIVSFDRIGTARMADDPPGAYRAGSMVGCVHLPLVLGRS